VCIHLHIHPASVYILQLKSLSASVHIDIVAAGAQQEKEDPSLFHSISFRSRGRVYNAQGLQHASQRFPRILIDFIAIFHAEHTADARPKRRVSENKNSDVFGEGASALSTSCGVNRRRKFKNSLQE
jgi:hypothetical protein